MSPEKRYVLSRWRGKKRMAQGAVVFAVDDLQALARARNLFPERDCAGDTYFIEDVRGMDREVVL